MCPKKTPDQVAHAEAVGQLEALLIRNHVPTDLAAAQAQEYVRDLTVAGWRHTRPRVDPVPPRGEPADPAYAARAAEWAREQLAKNRSGS